MRFIFLAETCENIDIGDFISPCIETAAAVYSSLYKNLKCTNSCRIL